MLNQINLARVDLNLLVLFQVVLEEGNVGRAAERLNLSPSAVSHGLSRLRRLLNDPLFLKHPKGVVATARATALARPIADILARVRGVIASADQFEAATSVRRFSIGAPDGISTVILPRLLAELARTAPGVNLSVHNTMTQSALADLDAGRADVAIVPLDEIPARFASAMLYQEEFVVAMRRGHPLGEKPTLKRYAAASHVIVSPSGDPYTLIDENLKARGYSRRVVVTVPSFLGALAIITRTDLVAAIPKSLAEAYDLRARLTLTPVPGLPIRAKIHAVVPKAAMADAGVGWLFALMESGARNPA
jgi:DNA-binding transcriptional LysR family regulator